MKKRSKILIGIVSFVAVVIIGATIYWFSMPSEQRNMVLFMATGSDSYENYEEYQVIDRNKVVPMPSAITPVVADTTDSDYNSNVTVITQMLLNETSKMLKKATVQINGADDYKGWQILADEGFDEDVNAYAPSPLSYLTTGASANLHTQVLRAAEVMSIELDSVSVEVLDQFHWENMMSSEGAGFLGDTYANIIIESDESEETIKELTDMALNAWVAGEGFANATTIDASLVVNGENWDNYRATPGTSLSDISTVNGLELTKIIDDPIVSDYINQAVEEISGLSFDAISNMKFEILATAISANNPERPYLTEVTVSFNTPDSETWVLYADEINGIDGIPVAPTSLEYLTAGTALCLTSQLTLYSNIMDLDFTEFRVEQQMDYREENINTKDMVGYTDTVHTVVLVESDESEERVNHYFNQSLSLCFAGEAFKGATDMHINSYLNGKVLK